jgi:hypothetical protein
VASPVDLAPKTSEEESANALLDYLATYKCIDYELPSSEQDEIAECLEEPDFLF